MARSLSLSRTLTTARSLLSSNSSSCALVYSGKMKIRHRSDQATAVEVHMNIDADTDAPVDHAVALKQLDDAIQIIVARRSAPDWLPFLPGSSYWVPPPRLPPSHALLHLISKLQGALTQEEAMSLTTARGWPSSSYYIHQFSDPDSKEPATGGGGDAYDSEDEG